TGDFFPSVHYPPITMYSPITEEALFRTYTVPDDGLFDIYAHIPFCQQRCLFCHYPVKLGKGREAEKDTYLAAMEKEMDIYMRRLGVDRIHARSILVGGGHAHVPDAAAAHAVPPVLHGPSRPRGLYSIQLRRCPRHAYRHRGLGAAAHPPRFRCQ